MYSKNRLRAAWLNSKKNNTHIIELLRQLELHTLKYTVMSSRWPGGTLICEFIPKYKCAPEKNV